MKKMHLWLSCAVASILTLFSLALMPGSALAQQYPAKRISIVAGVAPGSPFDLLIRVFADRLQKKFDVPVLVENVSGAQGLIATQRVLNAEPDGYTLLVASSGLLTLPHMLKDTGYVAEDFNAIAPLGKVPYILFAGSSVGATDVPSFMSYLKANAKDMNSGVLMSSQLSMLLSRKFEAIAGDQDLTTIPYRGSSDMMRALLANDIQMMATTYSVGGPQLDSGKIKAIGVLAQDRTQKMPNLPTFQEQGYPLNINVWAGLFVNARMPADIQAKIRAAAKEIVSDPTYPRAIDPTGMEPWSAPFDEFQARLNEDAAEFMADAKKFNLTFN